MTHFIKKSVFAGLIYVLCVNQAVVAKTEEDQNTQSPPQIRGRQKNKVSDAQLISNFQQSLFPLVGGRIGEAEIASDLENIRVSLLPLLMFAQKNVTLQNSLLQCISVLLTAGLDKHSQAAIRGKQDEALIRCQEEFVFFCSTTEEYEMISQCLNRLGLYYAPLSTAFSQIQTQTTQDTGDRNFKITAIALSAVAIIGIVYGLSR